MSLYCVNEVNNEAPLAADFVDCLKGVCAAVRTLRQEIGDLRAAGQATRARESAGRRPGKRVTAAESFVEAITCKPVPFARMAVREAAPARQPAKPTRTARPVKVTDAASFARAITKE